MGALGSNLAKVDGIGLLILGVVIKHKATAAQVACIGQRNGQGKTNGDRRINDIAALLKYRQGSFSGMGFFGGNYRLLSQDRLKNAIAVVISSTGCLGGGRLNIVQGSLGVKCYA